MNNKLCIHCKRPIEQHIFDDRCQDGGHMTQFTPIKNEEQDKHNVINETLRALAYSIFKNCERAFIETSSQATDTFIGLEDAEETIIPLLQQNRELVEGLRELPSIIPKEIDPYTVAEFIHKCLDARNKAEELLKKYDK